MLKALAILNEGLNNIEAKIIAVVHDEIIVECNEEQANRTKEIVINGMTKAMLTIFPNAAINGLIDAKIAKNWGEK